MYENKGALSHACLLCGVFHGIMLLIAALLAFDVGMLQKHTARSLPYPREHRASGYGCAPSHRWPGVGPAPGTGEHSQRCSLRPTRA